MKTEEIGTIIEDVAAGIAERNFNRRPVSSWFRATHGRETPERRERAWV